MHPTRDIAQSPLFQLDPKDISAEERLTLGYSRAKAIVAAYALTAKDILMLSPKFWLLHTDPIWAMDGAAGTLCTIQLNLCGGTLANFLALQPYLKNTVDKVLTFEYSGQFCLTEVGHGLDALHIETTATLTDDGEFELNTPSEGAAKFMPPTKPMGDPCIAVVFARTIVAGEDRGIKPFVVPINDGMNMSPGVVCKYLSQRGGSRPVAHSLTYFNHVRLPMSALLGALDKPRDARLSFLSLLSRVSIGTLAIGSLGVPALQVSSFIAACYSLRRMVTDSSSGIQRPIISFRTQKTPIVNALAQSFVMQALHDWAVPLFMDQSKDPRIRHAIAAIVKVVMMQHGQTANLGLGDRCGAQGLFEVNQLSAMFCDMRGTAISEGDTLGLSIRLASELLLQRYTVPGPVDSESFLAKHEAGLFLELKSRLGELSNHRGTEYDSFILPESLALIQAIGHRMAYDAAVKAEVDKRIIDVYVASCVMLDASWYVEALSVSRHFLREMEVKAIDAMFNDLKVFLAQNERIVGPYVTAPIISDERWAGYVSRLPSFQCASSSNTAMDAFPDSDLSPAPVPVLSAPMVIDAPLGENNPLIKVEFIPVAA